MVKWGPKAALVGYPKSMLRVPSLSLPIKWVYQDSVQSLTSEPLLPSLPWSCQLVAPGHFQPRSQVSALATVYHESRLLDTSTHPMDRLVPKSHRSQTACEEKDSEVQGSWELLAKPQIPWPSTAPCYFLIR